jgi:BASS family bile acid:Na+ symporter
MASALAKSACAFVQAFTWLGRQGTHAPAVLVFIGIAVPPLGALLKPYVTAAIFLLLSISFMRVDVAALRAYMRRPGVVLAATAWSMLVVPLVVGLICVAAGFDKRAPDVFLGLMLQASRPISAANAGAAIIGDVALFRVVAISNLYHPVPVAADSADKNGVGANDAKDEGRGADHRISDRERYSVCVRHLRARQCRHARSALRGARPHHAYLAAP